MRDTRDSNRKNATLILRCGMMLEMHDDGWKPKHNSDLDWRLERNGLLRWRDPSSLSLLLASWAWPFAIEIAEMIQEVQTDRVET